MDIYKILAIISPFCSAGLTGLITYRFTKRGKKFDLLYQFKVPAFKELSDKLSEYKNFCMGCVAFDEGNEYSPYWEDGAGTFHHRTEIANAMSINSIYFSPEIKTNITNLLNQMAGHCGIEAQIILGEHVELNLTDSYLIISQQAYDCIDKLYSELNLGT
jgi:hypothetical protein